MAKKEETKEKVTKKTATTKAAPKKKEEPKEVAEKKEVKETNVHKVEVKIDGDAWKNAVDKVFLEKQKTARVDGFRKGKVPRSVFEKKFGKESLYLDAADKVVEVAFVKAMAGKGYNPVIKPSVSLKDVSDTECVFEFTITEKPIINIKTYKGLNIKPRKVEVTDEEIEHELGHILERYTELVSKDEDSKIENGDVAIIDFEGFKDGKPFAGGKGENYSLEIGSNTFIPGFEEKMIGMKIGEEKDLDLTFPKDYSAKDLAGKDVVFKVKVHEIKTKQDRELDEDFFEDLGIEGVNSEASLKKHIKEEITTRKEKEVENDYVDELLEAVAKNVEIDIPEDLVEEEINRLMHRFEDQVRSQGLSLDLYFHFSNTTKEDLRNQFEKEAYTNVLYRFMLDEISELEHVEVTDEEAEQAAEDLSKKYGMTKDQFLENYGGMDFVKYDVEVRKVIDLLKEYNK